jgi:cellulose synthase/poly-beta-1,6-N-acetylglucosamine synthase-like glycosyltransferase
MNFIQIIFIIFQILIALHLVFPFFLIIIQLFKRRKNNETSKNNSEIDYAFIVTAYQQTSLLPNVVDSILKVNYDNYLIYIVADQCDISDLKFNNDKVILLRPEEELASNTKSHFYAIDRFKRAHERLTIIDSDNLVHPTYLNELNKVFDQGFEAVQGVREAKNLNTMYACLDAAGDIYYRYVDRKLLFDAGSSASLSGSGMAFTVKLYKECLEHLKISGAGFDKILQYEILLRKMRIAFADDAIVYDEKTSKTDQLVKQRARWINTWFKFFILGVKLFFKSLINFNINQLFFSLMLLRPPLFLLFGASFLCFAISLFVMPLAAFGWVICALLFVFAFYKSLSHFNADSKIYASLKGVPKFFYFQVLALFKAKRANELSVATKHDHDAGINDVD